MAQVDLTKISLPFKGTYDNSTTYVKKDIVVHTDTGTGSTSTYAYVNAAGAAGQVPSTSGTINTS